MKNKRPDTTRLAHENIYNTTALKDGGKKKYIKGWQKCPSQAGPVERGE